MRRVQEAVESCALYAVGTVGDALCTDEVEVVPKMLGDLYRRCLEVCAEGTWRLC